MNNLKHGIIGYLIIEDVLGKAPLVVDGVLVDAIVDVLVLQSGEDLYVDDITIDGKMLDLEHPDGTLEYRLTNNVDDDFMDLVYDEVERIALARAVGTPEDYWEYRAE